MFINYLLEILLRPRNLLLLVCRSHDILDGEIIVSELALYLTTSVSKDSPGRKPRVANDRNQPAVPSLRESASTLTHTPFLGTFTFGNIWPKSYYECILYNCGITLVRRGLNFNHELMPRPCPGPGVLEPRRLRYVPFYSL